MANLTGWFLSHLTLPRIFTMFGLLFGIAGAGVVAWGLFLGEEKAVLFSGQTGMSFLMDRPPPKADMLRQPAARDRVEQSRRAKWGFSLLFFGFIFQLVGTWLG